MSQGHAARCAHEILYNPQKALNCLSNQVKGISNSGVHVTQKVMYA